MKKKVILLASFAIIAGSSVLYALNSNSKTESCCSSNSSCSTEQTCGSDCSCGSECDGSGCECGCNCCE